MSMTHLMAAMDNPKPDAISGMPPAAMNARLCNECEVFVPRDVTPVANRTFIQLTGCHGGSVCLSPSVIYELESLHDDSGEHLCTRVYRSGFALGSMYKSKVDGAAVKSCDMRLLCYTVKEKPEEILLMMGVAATPSSLCEANQENHAPST